MRVCHECIADDGLMEVVDSHIEFADCDFCVTPIDTPMTCDLDIVVSRMRHCFAQDFCDPADIPDAEEKLRKSGNEPFNATSLFERVGLYIKNDKLLNELASHFSEHLWCERRWFGDSKSESHRDDWKRFCTVVKRHHEEAPDTAVPRISVSTLNTAYPDALRDLELVVALVPQTGVYHLNWKFWRVQILKQDETPVVPHRFTSPPPDKAKQPNRMSPAGVSMFYGADDLRTAYAETVTGPLAEDDVVWAVQFELSQPLEIIDLTQGLMIPSYFSDRGSDYLHESWFYHEFCKEVSKPIDRDCKQHLEYAPTQIMTEYFRDNLTTFNKERPYGMKFASSKTGDPSYVIFADQSQCLDDEQLPGRRDPKKPQLLRVVPSTLIRLSNGRNQCPAQDMPSSPFRVNKDSPGEYQFNSVPTDKELLILRAFQRQLERIWNSSIGRQGKVTFRTKNSLDLATGKRKQTFEGFDPEQFQVILPILRQFLLNDDISFNRVRNIVSERCGRRDLLAWVKHSKRQWKRTLNQSLSDVETLLAGKSFTLNNAIDRVFHGYGGLFHVNVEDPHENELIQTIEKSMIQKGFLDILERLSELDSVIYYWLDVPDEKVQPAPNEIE